MRLEGKIALVTGGARGIGRAIAEAFLREGAGVAVCDIDAAALLHAPGLTIHADVADLASHSAIVDAVLSRHGRIDILVNNAGVQIRRPFFECTPADWDRVFVVNLRAPYFLTQRVARAMAPGGAVVNVSSVHDTLPHHGNSIYTVSKGGLRMLTRALALELAAAGIRVNAIAPGAVDTEINRGVLAGPEGRARVEARIPRARIADPPEIAAAAVFLASGEATYITGATLYVDGGLLLK